MLLFHNNVDDTSLDVDFLHDGLALNRTLHGFGDSLLSGDVDYKAVFAALMKVGYSKTFTAEMIPFSRLPDLVLPDQALAEKTAAELRELCV